MRTAESATVSNNPNGRLTVARVVKGTKTYIIDFGQPIYANPVAEWNNDENGSLDGYQLNSQKKQ